MPNDYKTSFYVWRTWEIIIAKENDENDSIILLMNKNFITSLDRWLVFYPMAEIIFLCILRKNVFQILC
jgi:hypothetical protein